MCHAIVSLIACLVLAACQTAPADSPAAPISSAPTSPPQVISTGTWEEKSPMPTPRSEMPAALLDDLIYVPGGFGGGAELEAYDPVADTWAVLAPLPESRHHFMVAAFDGKLYAFGGGVAGSSLQWEAKATTWLYDPALDEWRTHDLASMPEPRLAGAAVAHGNYIYLIGGVGGSRATLRFDPAANQWAKLAPLGHDVEHTVVVVLDDEIYLLGGRWGATTGNRVDIYNIASDSWREGPPMNRRRAGHAAAVLDGRIYVFGGEVLSEDTLDSVEILDPVTTQWTIGLAMPYTLHGMPAVTVDGRIYVLGGSDLVASATNRGRVLVFTP